MAGALLRDSSFGPVTVGSRIGPWGTTCILPNAQGKSALGSLTSFLHSHSPSFVKQFLRQFLRQEVCYLKYLRSSRVPAFRIVKSVSKQHEGPQEEGRVSENLKQGPGIVGERALRSEVGEHFAYKTCSECRRGKLLCDFKPSQMTGDKSGDKWKTDLCRACMAKLFAVRLGKELHHLDISIEEAWEKAKVCRTCGHKKELRDYGRDIRNEDLVHRQCRSCFAAYDRVRFNKLVDSKLCARCGQKKPAKEFGLNKKRGQLDSYCKKCKPDYLKEHRLRLKDADVAYRGAAKLCMSCEAFKPRDQFSDAVGALDGLYFFCKPCAAIMKRQWRRALGRAEEGI